MQREVTYGMADVISARHAATHRTNGQGMNQPQTIPTCPPSERKEFNHTAPKAFLPNNILPANKGNEKVEVTEATTPMMEKENATVSMSLFCMSIK